MKVRQAELSGVQIIEPQVFGDHRGFLLETFSARRFADAGLPHAFVQDNHAFSCRGTLRGLHYQLGVDGAPGQTKLVRAVTGRVLDVAVDLRRGSPTFGRWCAEELSADNKRSLLVPFGFAHGYFTLEDADIVYKCSDYYQPALERGVAWDDPDLAIDWSVPEGAGPRLSARDAALPRLAELAAEDLPRFAAEGR